MRLLIITSRSRPRWMKNLAWMATTATTSMAKKESSTSPMFACHFLQNSFLPSNNHVSLRNFSSSQDYFSTNTTTATNNNNGMKTLQSLQSLAVRLQERQPVRAGGAATSTSTTDNNNNNLDNTTTTTDPPPRKRDLAAMVCKTYGSLNTIQMSQDKHDCERTRILEFLAVECGTNHMRNTPPPKGDDVSSLLEGILLKWKNTTTTDEVAMTNDDHDELVVEDRVLLKKLRHVVTPPYETILEFVLQHHVLEGITFLVTLREDLSRLIRLYQFHDKNNNNSQSSKNKDNHQKVQQLKDLDDYLQKLFSLWFSPGMLVTKRITYDKTPASILEYIALKEAVHPMKNLQDFKQRLGVHRRVFALFHPLLLEKPLVFVHVALTGRIPSSMAHVMHDDNHPTTTTTTTTTETPKLHPKVATFYSITNAQPGLAGTGLGEHLLKQAIERLQEEFSSIDTFVTLSPMPQFRKWVEDKLRQNAEHGHFYDDSFISQNDLSLLRECGLLDNNDDSISASSSSGGNGDKNVWQELLHLFGTFDYSYFANHADDFFDDDHEDREKRNAMRMVLQRLATRYIVLEKHRGKPLDGVTKFHTSNGAQVERINFAADLSQKGLRNSYGMMVNYRYDLTALAQHQKTYENGGGDYYNNIEGCDDNRQRVTIPIGPDVKPMLRDLV